MGRRIRHRGASRRADAHPPQQRRRGDRRGARGRSAAAHRLHLRLCHGRAAAEGRAARRSRSRSSRRARRRGCTCTHAFAEVAHRDAFVQGWRFQLSVFATLIADRLHAGAGRDRGCVVRGVVGSRRGDARGERRRASPRPASASAIATASSPGSRICTRTSPPCTASCPACASSAPAPCGTARASSSPTGSRAATDGAERGPRPERLHAGRRRPHRRRRRLVDVSPARSCVRYAGTAAVGTSTTG